MAAAETGAEEAEVDRAVELDRAVEVNRAAGGFRPILTGRGAVPTMDFSVRKAALVEEAFPAASAVQADMNSTH